MTKTFSSKDYDHNKICCQNEHCNDTMDTKATNIIQQIVFSSGLSHIVILSHYKRLSSGILLSNISKHENVLLSTKGPLLIESHKFSHFLQHTKHSSDDHSNHIFTGTGRILFLVAARFQLFSDRTLSSLSMNLS